MVERSRVQGQGSLEWGTPEPVGYSGSMPEGSMNSKAIFLIKTIGGGSPLMVNDALGEMPGITESHIVAGEYDIVVRISRLTIHQVAETASKIRGMEGVRKMDSQLVINGS